MSADVVINPPVNWTQPASSNAPPGPVDLTVADPLLLNGTLMSIKPASLTSNGYVTTAAILSEQLESCSPMKSLETS